MWITVENKTPLSRDNGVDIAFLYLFKRSLLLAGSFLIC